LWAKVSFDFRQKPKPRAKKIFSFSSLNMFSSSAFLKFVHIVSLSCWISNSTALSLPKDSVDTRSAVSRRSIIGSGVASCLVAVGAAPASAFDNAIADYAKYVDKPKRRGTPPKDLGVLPRTIEGEDDRITQKGLRTCDGNPNCFSTTGDFRLEDRQQYGVDFLIAPWKSPSTEKAPLKTLSTLIKTEYEPGQGGIDGGGFSVVKETDSYLYYQFESLKKGYIDDLEFATSGTGDTTSILVRSASRSGFTDFGVNAVRLNYIASKLRTRGWIIDEITEESHRDYWNAADEARGATFDPDRRRMGGGGEDVNDKVKATMFTH
jgi:hypothetical protein